MSNKNEYNPEDTVFVSWIDKEGKKVMKERKPLPREYYTLEIKDSSLSVEETHLETHGDERYILFGESDPFVYLEQTADAIIEEFKEFNFVKVLA